MAARGSARSTGSIQIACILLWEPAVGGGDRFFTGVVEDTEEESLDEWARLIGPWNEKAGR